MSRNHFYLPPQPTQRRVTAPIASTDNPPPFVLRGVVLRTIADSWNMPLPVRQAQSAVAASAAAVVGQPTSVRFSGVPGVRRGGQVFGRGW